MQMRRSLDGMRALALIEDEALLRRLQHCGSTLGIEVTPVRCARRCAVGLRASATMGERWRHSLLVVDCGGIRAGAARRSCATCSRIRCVSRMCAACCRRMAGARPAAGSRACAAAGDHLRRSAAHDAGADVRRAREPGFPRAEPRRADGCRTRPAAGASDGAARARAAGRGQPGQPARRAAPARPARAWTSTAVTTAAKRSAQLERDATTSC